MALRAVLFVGRAGDDDGVPFADGTAPVNDPGLRIVRGGNTPIFQVMNDICRMHVVIC